MTAGLHAELLAEIARREKIARAAMVWDGELVVESGSWRIGLGKGEVRLSKPWSGSLIGEVVVYDEGQPSAEQAAHIVANDPATVLRQLAGVRAVVERHSVTHQCYAVPGVLSFCGKVDPCLDLRTLHDAYCGSADG